MIPKIRYAQALPNYQLFLIFDNGSIKVYDLLHKLENPIYSPLKDWIFFSSLKVDTGGYGISWNDDIDLSENECWQNSREISQISRLVAEMA